MEDESSDTYVRSKAISRQCKVGLLDLSSAKSVSSSLKEEHNFGGPIRLIRFLFCQKLAQVGAAPIITQAKQDLLAHCLPFASDQRVLFAPFASDPLNALKFILNPKFNIMSEHSNSTINVVQFHNV